MIVCGCDLGSATGKVVLMEGEDILSWAVVRATASPEKTALAAMDEAIRKAGFSSMEDVQYVVATGYGRMRVPFLKENISEITCHARGAHWLCPEVRTVVDVGGQDCKVISLNDRGKVLEFAMNDKCAAGTGRFFEAMARGLDCSLERLAQLSLESDTPATITKQCSVFAESEVVTLINNGVNPADIAAGVHDSIAARLYGMIYRVGLIPQVVLTGGCANNQGLIRAMEKRMGITIMNLSVNPQIAGALGAALLAREHAATPPTILSRSHGTSDARRAGSSNPAQARNTSSQRQSDAAGNLLPCECPDQSAQASTAKD